MEHYRLTSVTLHEDWDLPCSDDEFSKQGNYSGNSWVVDVNELEELYNKIDKSGTLTLEWKCLGRRTPSPLTPRKESRPEVLVSAVKDEKYDFDFVDEVTSLKLRVRREGEYTLRGSAKKKTTSFDGVLSNLIRHKRIEQMEEQANAPTSSPST